MGSKTLDEIVSCNERENWKGLGNEQPKKRAKYIRGEFDSHHFEAHKNLSNIQLLKNGNNTSLLPIRIDSIN